MSFAKPVSGLAPSLLLLGLGAAALLFDPLGAATMLRGKLFDAYESRSQIAASDDSRVELVTLDAGSLAHYGSWPWPDSGLSDLTRAIVAAGAEIVVFTTPLDRPDSDNFPASLQSLSAEVPITLGVGGLTPHPTTKFEYRGDKDPFAQAPHFAIGAGPDSAVARAAAGMGAPNLILDRDGVVRRMPLAFQLNTLLIPSLSAEAARLANGDKRITVTAEQSNSLLPRWQAPGIAALESGSRSIATERDGRFWINYAQGPEEISAGALLSHELASGALKNKILVLDTPGDKVATPIGRATRGTVIALGIQNILAGSMLVRPDFALAAEVAGLLAAGGLIMLLMAKLPTPWAALFTAFTVLAALYASWFAYLRLHWLMDAATPGITLVLVLAAAGNRGGAGGPAACFFGFPAPRQHRENRASARTAFHRRRNPHHQLSGLRCARHGGTGRRQPRQSQGLHPHHAAGDVAFDGSGAGAWRHHRPAHRRRLCRFLERAAGR